MDTKQQAIDYVKASHLPKWATHFIVDKRNGDVLHASMKGDGYLLSNNPWYTSRFHKQRFDIFTMEEL